MERYQKILLGIFITAIIIVGSIQIYFSLYLEEQLKETAVERFHEETEDAYDLEIDDFNLHILGRQLSLSGIELSKKSDTQGTEILATLDEFNVSGIGLIKLLLQQELTVNQIEFINPDVYITAERRGSSSQQMSWSHPSQQLSKMALNIVNHISIPNLSITGLSVAYTRADLPVDPLFSISDSDITFYNITIDSTSLNDGRIIPADNIATTLKDIRLQTPNELYDISAGSMELSTINSTMLLSDIILSPRHNKGDFAEHVGHQIDRIDLTVDEIKCDNINTEELNKTKGFTASLIKVSNADLDVYRDKRKPERPKSYKPLPQEIIRDIPFPTTIDSIHINESNIRYTEQKPEAEKAGYIEFANLSATLMDLTNVKEQWEDGKIPTLHAQTNVMNQALLDAHFSFPMMKENNRQEIKGSLQSMDMHHLNNALEPLAFVRIDEGKILGLDFEMNLSSTRAGGKLTLKYEGLKISLLDNESNEENFSNKAKSLLANTFKIKSNNKDDNLRTAKVDFERIENKSVFNYWWKSLLSGLKSSIGL